MILSASGWRTVFARSGKEEDSTIEISDEHNAVCKLIAYSFAKWYLKNYADSVSGKQPKIALATDTRPTGKNIAKAMIPVLHYYGIDVKFVGPAAAPEIMAYARNLDAFIYISASHNPIGHNGIKFGLNDGGVIDGEKSKDLISFFKDNCSNQRIIDEVCNNLLSLKHDEINRIYALQSENKGDCIYAYMEFSKQVITSSKDKQIQDQIFNLIKKATLNSPISIAADLNGSARTLSIDNEIFSQNNIPFFTINDQPYKIAHAIIPEPENLVHVASFMEELYKQGQTSIKLGYMPDCDGDRGNIVYWNGDSACILKAQEVFSISVLAELCYMDYLGQKFPQYKSDKVAVAVNDPTSMRIEEIARNFSAKVGRAEVGEANVVNLARELRSQGYQVRILGEGSNGGTITYPACVLDPINTICALLKLLCLKDEIMPDGKICYGLFHRWCIFSHQEKLYKQNFSIQDIVDSLPVYTTTGVSEERAVLHVNTVDHAVLKAHYQTEFEKAWVRDRKSFFEPMSIFSWRAFCNNGTKQTDNVEDFSISGRGGLKIVFYDEMNYPISFIWMRGSGTEPVFRVMCDVKGNNPVMEKKLLAWHTELIKKADSYK
ncbi:MAG: phosphoglucomutase [Treponemataceae bacterium]|nr:phosphoglucomutase [Treponemataceae bacterium]